MNLPYIQVEVAVLEQCAPDLAILLDWTEEAAGWGLVKMFRYALGRVPAGAFPSEHAIVPGPTAAKLLARAAGYQGDPEAFVDACEQVRPPVLERRPEGIRARGLSRYDTALKGQLARAAKAKAAADARWGNKPKQPTSTAQELPGHTSNNAPAMLEHSSADAPTMPRDAKTETETGTETKAFKPSDPENFTPAAAAVGRAPRVDLEGDDAERAVAERFGPRPVRDISHLGGWANVGLDVVTLDAKSREFKYWVDDVRKGRGLGPPRIETVEDAVADWYFLAHAKHGLDDADLRNAYLHYLETFGLKGNRDGALAHFISSEQVWLDRARDQRRARDSEARPKPALRIKRGGR